MNASETIRRSLAALLCVAATVPAMQLRSQDRNGDTIVVGGMVIIRKKTADTSVHPRADTARRPEASPRPRRNIETNWFVLDIGFSGYEDRTDYAGLEAQEFIIERPGTKPNADFLSLRNGRLSNFNVWFLQQQMNLYRHIAGLRYGFGLEGNNYFFRKPVTYVDGMSTNIVADSVSFRKNKLFASYLTVPLMLTVDTRPGGRKGGLHIGFGVSGGYLFRARQKQVSDEGERESRHSGFNLNPWKLAWLAELGFGPLRLYGSLSATPLHRYGLDQHPYIVGLRFISLPE